jgi:DNA-binding HxlR family transcriptional regulator
VRQTSFSDFTCSIARTVEVVGERWTPLVLRDLFLGVTRFEDIQRDLGIARNVLAERLETLVESGIAERRPYQGNPPRHDYVLTDKGRELYRVLLALMAWGDRWTAGEAGPPVKLRHESCGKLTTPELTCSCCGEPLTLDTVTALAGPGGRRKAGTRVVAERLAAGPRRLAEL